MAGKLVVMSKIDIRKVFVEFCLFLIPISFVYSQKEIKQNCKQNLYNILSIQEFKYKYEIVKFLYKYRNGGIFWRFRTIPTHFFRKKTFFN